MVRMCITWLMLFAVVAAARGQDDGLTVWVLDDIVKPPKDQTVVRSSATVFDGTARRPEGGGKRGRGLSTPAAVETEGRGRSCPPGGFRFSVQPSCELFLEFYQKILRGGYGWGGGMGSLPWKDKHYPDPLIPLYDPYSPAHGPITQGFTLDPTNGPNQGIWVDVFIPKGFPAGKYKSVISMESDRFKREIPVSLQVYNFSLPDQTHCDGYGELYFLDSDERGFQEDPGAIGPSTGVSSKWAMPIAFFLSCGPEWDPFPTRELPARMASSSGSRL